MLAADRERWEKEVAEYEKSHPGYRAQRVQRRETQKTAAESFHAACRKAGIEKAASAFELFVWDKVKVGSRLLIWQMPAVLQHACT